MKINKFMKLLHRNSIFVTLAIAVAAAFLFLNFQNKPQTMLTINNGDYEVEWREIDSLDQQNLPKSALEKVVALHEKAQQENNPPQIIKTLIYRGKYQSQLEEDGLVQAIYRMEEEITAADFPTQSLLESMLAEMYQNYLENNRWKFQNRTTAVDFKSEDIRTWTIEQLVDKTGELYFASLENKRTRNVEIKDFDAILSTGKNHNGIRPTLYDFLANRAIDYFKNDQAYLSQPENQFQIDNPDLFKSSGVFSEVTIETGDSTSFKYKTLLVFQDLLAWHQDAKMKIGNITSEAQKPWIIADLQRLKFVYDNAILPNKDELYLNALSQNLLSSIGENNADVWYEIARFWYQKGSQNLILDEKNESKIEYKDVITLNKNNPTNQWDWKKANFACGHAMEKYLDSFAGKHASALQRNIEQQNLNLQLEQVNLPEKPLLILAEYRNVEQAFLKAIRFNDQRREALQNAIQEEHRNNNNQVLNYLNGLPTVQKTSNNLPQIGDYRQHTTELMLEGLPLGQYCVMVSNNADFSKANGTAGYAFTNISKIGNWYRRINTGVDEFTVFNRENGQPMQGVEAYFSKVNYNANNSLEEVSKDAKKVVSNENGFLKVPDLEKKNRYDNNQYSVLFKSGKDSLYLNDRYSSYSYDNNPRKQQTTHFFLDRAIYRPSQTVYFKGIAIETDTERMPSILANKKVTVTFRDANYQEVAKQELQTNEYGTFNGNFTAPQGGLLGNMTIQSSIGGSSKNFKVEEYKRPKFEVNFEPITGSFKLDETVKVTGKAVAFAGNNIDGASVKYRVVREVRFPWMPWWYWRGGYNPWGSESQQIATGEAVTDAEGKFDIEFTALPDRSVPMDKKPEFIYTVSADVVDITGETHTGTQQVKVGVIALQIDVPLASQLNADSLKRLTISSLNLNGAFEAATGIVLIEKLKVPETVFVKRFWAKPDNQMIAEGQFKKVFPHLAFGEEDEIQNWKVERTVFNEKFDTEKAKELLLPKSKLTTGQYVLTIKTKDRFGTEVEKKKNFQIYDLSNKNIPVAAVGWHHLEKSVFEPHETAEIYFGTAEKSLPILFEMERNGDIISRKWLTVKDLNKQNYTVQEADRGNVFYHFSYAQHNRSFNQSNSLQVPWKNKDLTIEYSTFRDKLRPGQAEEWTLKIKGPKGEKVAAEMVAAMYDASLDEFAANSWNMNLFPMNYSQMRWEAKGFSATRPRFYQGWNNSSGGLGQRVFERLNWFGFTFYQRRYESYGNIAMSAAPRANKRRSAPAPEMEGDMMAMEDSVVSEDEIANMETVSANAVPAKIAGVSSKKEEEGGENKSDLSNIKVRTNLNETVFFFPNLMTDAEGNVLIKFTMNEALTKWKFLGLAHTKDLKFGTTTNEVVTQKDLMVMPNAPRFFRERDLIEYTAKVVNLSDKALSGTYKLELKNPMTGEDIFPEKGKTMGVQLLLQERDFKDLQPGASQLLSWKFKVPDVSEVSLIEHTVFAQAGDFSDAERSVVPVLSNRMLVTETMPLPVRENSTKTFTLQSLKNADSESLSHHQLTVEFTSNPAWYAVQALPYLMEYPYDCTEQVFSRYYANTLASHVANSTPKIKAVFEKWRDYEPEALASNLSKNQELKSALLEETPWVLNAQSEEQQKKNIALLFDLNKMSHEQDVAFRKLKERQLSNGGWSWFPGGRDSWYITQYLVEGFGHLDALGVADVTENGETWRMVRDAISYIDARMVERYEELEKRVKEGKTKWEDDHLGNLEIHYLYARSFFLNKQTAQANKGNANPSKGQKYIALEGKAQRVFDYYRGQTDKYWTKKGMYQEGLIALANFRVEQPKTANAIVKSLRERSLNSDEMGMYWKYNRGYWWYQLPIETHSLMIEVFDVVAQDAKSVNDLKVWLLKNKQTNHWKTTKATAAATYALLATGANWLDESAPVHVNFDAKAAADLNAQIKTAQQSAQAGMGYFKTSIDGEKVDKSMATVTVSNPNKHPAWGGMYWQYFEDLDKIKTFEETPLTIKKQLFLVTDGDRGEQLQTIDNEQLNPGEKLKVRIELRVDRDMEYIHMKDMRASGFEPINAMSRYKWQDGLGYYESTRDASTNFFFSRLPKGTYVFEYPLRVVLAGDFSNGVTTVQSMYAPEFSSHSEGVRVKVERE
ncbi:MAG: hypothetical protein ACI9XO_004283 [Paraglaciecola sp.]|jgi:uncharacterized protein YfaS (alpha-2-macroglobulin family)